MRSGRVPQDIPFPSINMGALKHKASMFMAIRLYLRGHSEDGFEIRNYLNSDLPFCGHLADVSILNFCPIAGNQL